MQCSDGYTGLYIRLSKGIEIANESETFNDYYYDCDFALRMQSAMPDSKVLYGQSVVHIRVHRWIQQ